MPGLSSHKRFAPFLVGLVSFLVYAGTIGHGYNLDDELVTNNVLISKGLGAIPEILTSRYIENEKQSFDYRPFVKISYAIEYSFWGFRPDISHLINCVLYSFLTGLLCYWLCQLPGITTVGALFVALVFALHPTHTETVCSLKSRDELIGGILLCCGFLLYHRYTKSGWWVYLLGCTLLAYTALLSKVSAATAYVALPILGYCFYGLSLQKTIFHSLIVALALPILLLLIDSPWIFGPRIRVDEFVELPFQGADVITKAVVVSKSLLFYCKQTVIAYPLKFYYGYNTITIDDGYVSMVGSLFLFAGFIVALVFTLRRRSPLMGMIVCLGLSYFPALNLLTNVPGIVADRHVFYGALFFGLVLYFGYIAIEKRVSPRVLYAMGGILLFVYGGMTLMRIPDWKDTETLFRADIHKLEHSARANYMLGNILLEKGMKRDPKDSVLLAASVLYSRRAFAVYDRYTEAMNNAGTALHAIGKWKEALHIFQRAIRLSKNDSKLYYNSGLCYEQLNMIDSAALHYLKAIDIQPADYAPYDRMSRIFYKVGRVRSGIEMNQEYLEKYDATNKKAKENLEKLLYHYQQDQMHP